MAEIFPLELHAGLGCAHTGRIEGERLRLGPGRRRLWPSHKLRSMLGIEAPIVWLNQTHSSIGVDADSLDPDDANQVRNCHGNLFTRQACDFAHASRGGIALAISVADCVPVALHDSRSHRFGLCHAGWQGLAHNVIGAMMRKSPLDPQHTHALIGPHICRECFDIDHASYERFTTTYPGYEDCFRAREPSRQRPDQPRYLCDLNAIAQEQLRRAGVNSIDNQHQCTRCAQDGKGWRFPSWRRDRSLERIAMLVWRKDGG